MELPRRPVDIKADTHGEWVNIFRLTGQRNRDELRERIHHIASLMPYPMVHIERMKYRGRLVGDILKQLDLEDRPES